MTNNKNNKPKFIEILEKYQPILPWITASVSVFSFLMTVLILKKK